MEACNGRMWRGSEMLDIGFREDEGDERGAGALILNMRSFPSGYVDPVASRSGCHGHHASALSWPEKN